MPKSARTPSCFLSLLALIFTLANGCGPQGPETVYIEGTVEFKDAERPKHCVIFYRPISSADGSMRPASGKMEEDGTFEVTSFRPGDGVKPGEYSVLIEYHRLKPGGDPNSDHGWQAFTYEPENLIIQSGVSGALTVNYSVPAP